MRRSMSPSTSPGARKARNSMPALSSLLTTVQKLATSREAGRRVEGWLPDSILQESINVVLWMREKEQALQLHRQRGDSAGRCSDLRSGLRHAIPLLDGTA